MSGLIQMAVAVLVLQTSLLNLAGIDIILANWLSGLEAVCNIPSCTAGWEGVYWIVAITRARARARATLSLECNI